MLFPLAKVLTYKVLPFFPVMCIFTSRFQENSQLYIYNLIT
jgi:hypothetical protein